MRLINAIVVLWCVGPADVHAQMQLPSQLSATTRGTLEGLIDSARTAGLPTEPLVAKAAEGVLKRVTEDRVVNAVRLLVRRQGEARSVLPKDARDGTLAAAVSALQAGVSLQTLKRLASVPTKSESDLAVALVAVADLSASQVPAEAAALAIEQLLKRGASEHAITNFRLGVAEEIRLGRGPERALDAQTSVWKSKLGPFLPRAC